jgi:hypothetical protein
MKTHSKQPKVGKPKKAPRLWVVKLEGRITPRIALNHNETLAREPARDKVKAQPKKALRLQMAKLEPRIAPGLWSNHNETLVRDRA